MNGRRMQTIGFGLSVAMITVLGGCSSMEQGSQSPAQRSETSTSRSTKGWELTADNTGLRSVGLECAKLAAYTGPTDVPAGTRIVEQRISTTVNLSQGDIVIERSCIQPTQADRGMPVVGTTNYNTMTPVSGKVIIRDSEFDGSRLKTQDAAMVAAFIGLADLTNNYVHDFGSGIALMNTGERLSSTIEHNFVANLVAWGDGATTGNHSDAFTVRDFDAQRNPQRTLDIRNNRFDCDSGNDTGALFIQTYAGRIDNVNVEGNLLEGGGYQLGLNEANNPYSNVRSVDNRFEGSGYGPAYVQGGTGWNAWQDNFLHDAAQPDARGAAVPSP